MFSARYLTRLIVCLHLSMIADWTSIAYAAPQTIDLSSEEIHFDGQHELEWAESTDPQENPANIATNRWTKTVTPPHFGAGPSTIWYRFSLKNPSETPRRFSFMSLDGMISDVVKLVVIRDHKSDPPITVGTSLPRSVRPIDSLQIVLPIDFQPQETVTALVGIQSSYTRNLHYQIRSESSRHKFESRLLMFFGFYFGTLFLVILLTTLTHIALRDHITLIYGIFVAGSIITSFIGMGFLNFLIPDDWIINSAKVESVLVPLFVGIIGLFTRDFLETKKWCRPAWHYYNISSSLAFLCALFIAIGHPLPGNQMLLEANITVTSIFGFAIAGLGAWRKATPLAGSFLLGFGLYIVGGNLWSNQFGMHMPSEWWNVYAIHAAQIGENMVFSLAVMRMIRRKVIAKTSDQESARYGNRMSMFVKVLTHDLSNYISIIDYSLGLIAKPGISENARNQLLQKSMRALEQQKEVLDSIKELKAVEDGKATLTLEKVDIKSVLNDLPETFERRLKAKNVRLNITSHGQTPIVAWADRKTLFHSVISNLVSNAIKFSHENGEIQITAEAAQDHVTLRIDDHGIGMPADLASKIFDDHEKTSRLGTSGEKGTGFGLPICKAYMSLYKGSISVTSRPKDVDPVNHGTSFTLQFKRAA